MKKRVLLFVLFSVSLLSLKAQQDPYYTHFMLNKQSFNPAAAGVTDAICADLLGHRQWVGYNNDKEREFMSKQQQELGRKALSPTTEAMNFSMPFLPYRGSRKGYMFAGGVSFINDQVGYSSALSIKGVLAFRYVFSGNQFIQLGVAPGLMQRKMDPQYFNPLDPGDPNIPTTVAVGSAFDMDAGIYYKNPALANLYVGLSVTHLMAPPLVYSGGVNGIDTSKKHFYLMAGTQHSIGGNIILEPNILIKKDPTIFQYEANARAIFNNKFVAGLSYRNGGKIRVLETFSPQFGYYVKYTKKTSFYIGYSYDIPLIQPARTGTHEIVATYCFILTGKPEYKPFLRGTRNLGGMK